MNYKYFLFVFIFLNNCGFKGNLYIPKEDKKETFGAIQTGIKINYHKDKKNAKKNK